jgi:DNA mismatch endonuclease, patch repair protein
VTDIVSKAKRSAMMSGIRGKNTKPEILVRRLLHGMGFRFRLHRKDLPGKPDIVLPKWRTVVFVNGCYWHGHADCDLFRLPKSRTEFWQDKIDGNRVRDQRNYSALKHAGWKTVVIWECAVSKKRQLSKDNLEKIFLSIKEPDQALVEIRGYY